MFFRRILWTALLVAGLAAPALAGPPAPVLKYVGKFPDAGLIHVDLTVLNWHVYPPALFAPAPHLPPCGTNTASSRTWVDIYNAGTNQRIYGFCALSAPDQLQKIWFATAPAAKPKAVFIKITDRLLKQFAISNKVLIP
jgi:hypothetical protein